MDTKRRHSLNLALLAAILLGIWIVSFLFARSRSVSPANRSDERPLFVNKIYPDKDTGRAEGWPMTPHQFANGSYVLYDENRSILVVGLKSRPSDYLQVPYLLKADVAISSGAPGHEIRLPVKRNSCILFDRSGLLEIVDLKNGEKARDIFGLIQADEGYVFRIFRFAAASAAATKPYSP